MAVKRRPKDTNQLAKLIVDLATGSASEPDPDAGKDPTAVSRGRLGGRKGGEARAANLPPSERRKIAQKAARARWRGKKLP